VHRLVARPELGFFRALLRADRRLALCWYGLLLVQGLLPTVFAVATGALVGDIGAGRSIAGPLVAVGAVFIALQVVAPLQSVTSANLGSRTSAYLYDRLTDACVTPPGLGHLEDPELADDLTVAREFDLGLTGPPMSVDVEFIAGSLGQMVAGAVAVLTLFACAWWAPFLVGGAWISTHFLLRESSVWFDRNTPEVRGAQRDADYAFRMAVDPPAAKELRLFGLAGWTVERFADRRRRLHDLQYAATRLRERPLLLSLLIVGGANVLFFWLLSRQHLPLDRTVVFAQLAVAASTFAFGGLSWAMDGAAAPVAAVRRLAPRMASAGALARGAGRAPGDGPPAIRFADVSFGYPRATRPVFSGLDLELRAGESLAIVGQNGAGKTTLAKLLCRLYEPTGGAILVDGVPLTDLDVAAWRGRITAVFQDFLRLELPLRDNVDPGRRATDEQIRAALADAGADGLADLGTPLSRSFAGGTDLSGGQWQRVALARALCAVRAGAGLVLLDEPTAQLDVRGEAEIFGRILAATRDVTTVLISHRFSTVRHADRICVLEHGRVVELGTHEELMAAGGRYRTMFDLQAQRFTEGAEDEDTVSL
jgi:ATP-binding cassette subfamily B protein